MPYNGCRFLSLPPSSDCDLRRAGAVTNLALGYGCPCCGKTQEAVWCACYCSPPGGSSEPSLTRPPSKSSIKYDHWFLEASNYLGSWMIPSFPALHFNQKCYPKLGNKVVSFPRDWFLSVIPYLFAPVAPALSWRAGVFYSDEVRYFKFWCVLVTQHMFVKWL